MSSVQNARLRKTILYFQERELFLHLLEKDIASIVRRAGRKGYEPCVRLNGTSDIRWERHGIMEKFPEVQFYDYTKIVNRRDLPDNYSLTFSRSECNQDSVEQALSNGMNVAAVFNELPSEWMGLPVIDGDLNDLRFKDPKPCIVGLLAKGSAKKDDSGFVIFQ
jgi:hypothetical protein